MRLRPVGHSGFTAVDTAGLIGPSYATLPFSLRVLAESAARHSEDGAAAQLVAAPSGDAVPFRPARLLLHDMLGIPALVDIMAMRDHLAESGGNPNLVDMSLPVVLIIDHSMTINN